MSSTPPSLGNRGSVPEATSVLLFTLVAGLLWYALVRTGEEVRASEPGASAQVPSIGTVDSSSPALEAAASAPHAGQRN